MDPVTRDSFRGRLAALPPDDFESFVADLWTARGRELRRTGRRLVARSPETDAVEVLYVLPTDGDLAAVPRAGIDVVVAARPVTDDPDAGSELPGDVRVIDADELRRIARYAVDRDTASRLLASHLDYASPGFPVREADGRRGGDDETGGGERANGHRAGPGSTASAPDAPEARRTRHDGAVDTGEPTDGPRDWLPAFDRRAALLGGAALAGLAAVGVPSSGIRRWESPAGGQLTLGDDQAAEDPSDTPSAASAESETAVAPWLTSDGEVDPRALAAAHAGRLRETSFSLEVERAVRGTGGSLRSLLRVDVAVALDRTYVARVETAGPHAPLFLGVPPARATFWSDGETYVRRFSRADETTYNQFVPPDNHVGTWRYWVNTVSFGGRDGHARAFVAALFGGVQARIAGRTTVNGREAYRLLTWGGRPDAGTFRFAGDVDDVDDVAVDALVDVDGLVSSLDLSYAGDHGGAPARVRRTVRYPDVGDTAVDRPAWYARAIEGGTSASNSSETAGG